MKLQMEGQEGECTATIQSTKNWMHDAPATSERIRLWQIDNPSRQVTEPRHDLRAGVSEIIKPADVSNVRMLAGLKLRNELKYRRMDPVDMIDRHVRRPSLHHGRDPGQRGYRAATTVGPTATSRRSGARMVS